MRLVDAPVTFPSRCSAIPFHAGSYEGRWVDTGAEVPASAKDSHVYLSEAAVEACAVLLGWTHPTAVADLTTEVERLQRQVQQLAAELDEADRLVKAIDVLESADFTRRKKPGRPRKEEAAV